MRKSIFTLAVGLALGAGLVLLFSRSFHPPHDEHEEGGHDGHDHGKEKEKEKDESIIELPPAARKAAGIRAVTIEKRRVGSVLAATAVIRPNADQVAHVSSKVTGRVVEIKAVQGSEVKQGDPLLVLDSIDVGTAAADYLKAKAGLEVAKINFDREDELMKKGAGRGTDFYEAKGQHVRAQAEFEAARERLRLLGWSVERIKSLKWEDPEGLSRVTITAPVDGEVIEKHATIGEVVSPETNLYTLANLSSVWVIIDLYQKDIRRVHKDQPIEATFEGHPGRPFKGKVTYVGKVFVEETRTLEVRVELENKAGLLRPGMYVTASIMDDQDEHARECLCVPASAVQRVDGVTVIFVAKAPGTYERRPVTLGERFGDLNEVLVGLEPGEMVVSEGSFTLKSELLRSRMGHGHAH